MLSDLASAPLGPPPLLQEVKLPGLVDGGFKYQGLWQKPKLPLHHEVKLYDKSASPSVLESSPHLRIHLLSSNVCKVILGLRGGSSDAPLSPLQQEVKLPGLVAGGTHRAGLRGGLSRAPLNPLQQEVKLPGLVARGHHHALQHEVKLRAPNWGPLKLGAGGSRCSRTPS